MVLEIAVLCMDLVGLIKDVAIYYKRKQSIVHPKRG